MSTKFRRSFRLLVVPLVLLSPLGLALSANAAPAHRAPAPTGAYIVLFHGGVDAHAKAAQLQRERRVRAKKTYDKSVRGVAANLDSSQVSALRSDPDVALVAPDLPVHATSEVGLTAGDSVPTGVRRIGAGSTTTARQASSATVAVIDTGVDLTNPDLNVSPGPNCVGGTTANDDEGHGTHVAGTIAAKNNGTGVVGVAPGTHLDAVKVLDSSGGGTYSQIICGIDWVTGTRTDADLTNDVSVANLSLGGVGQALGSCSTTTDALHKAICGATAAGVTFVVAAGNDGYDYDYAPSPDTPAAYPEVLTVTAESDSDGAPGGTGGSPSCWGGTDDSTASFSNYATTAGAIAHTIAAPGVCITSDAPGGGTAVMSGTSMATPHMTGEVALCLGEGSTAGPCAGLTPAQIIAKMRSDAAAYTTANPGFGFTGDPAHPVSGKYYGYLGHVASTSATAVPAPTVTAVSPTDNRVAVPLTAPVTVTFSKPMNLASAQAAFALVRQSTGTTVPGSFSWSGNTMTFKPSAALVAGAVYNAKVAAGARAVDGTALASSRSWSFRGVLTTHVTPSSVTVSGGVYRSGSASSLAADDSLFYVVASSGTSPSAAFYGTVSGVNNDLASLSWAYAGKNSASATQVLSLWNWTTSRWVTVDTRTVGTTVLTERGDAAGTMADYVSGTTGTGSIRFQVRSTRSSSFTTSGGRMALQYTR